MPFTFPRCEVVPLPDHQAAFRIDGAERLRWHFGPSYPRPFFFPLIGPSGTPLTRMGHPGDPGHDLRVTLGSLGYGIALERHADCGIVFLHGTDHLTTCLDIRDGFVCGLVHGPRLLYSHEGPPKIRNVKVPKS